MAPLPVSVNILVRNGIDFIVPVISAVAPHVEEVIVTVDSNSLDGSAGAVFNLKSKFDNLRVFVHIVHEPFKDLIVARNAQITLSNGKYIWVIDSDEYYPENAIAAIRDAIAADMEGYTVKNISPWNLEKYHKASSRRRIGRIVKNKPGLFWAGQFGRERLTYHGKEIFTNENTKIGHLPVRYIHFTHLKHDTWRTEFGMLRVADNKHLEALPEDIKKITNDLYEKRMSFVRF